MVYPFHSATDSSIFLCIILTLKCNITEFSPFFRSCGHDALIRFISSSLAHLTQFLPMKQMLIQIGTGLMQLISGHILLKVFTNTLLPLLNMSSSSEFQNRNSLEMNIHRSYLSQKNKSNKPATHFHILL